VAAPVSNKTNRRDTGRRDAGRRDAGKILIAEDDPEARELLTLLLAAGEYDVVAAADGVEALQLLRTEDPDLLITDIVMPRMDGYELVRQLRENAATAALPVIFCSASYHEREVRSMARSLGVITTLAKPYDIGAVTATVARALESPQPESSEGDPAPLHQAAQDRLNAFVAFTRQLFTTRTPEEIPASACRAAREILMAQCAQLVVRVDNYEPSLCRESGLTDACVERLYGSALCKDLLATVEQGGSALYPMVPPAPVPLATPIPPGELVSMLGVPIASGSRVYGHLCVLNRIGLGGFTEEDLAVARALAAQVAVACENAARTSAVAEQVAQRAAAEAEVRRLNQDLERRVAERTAELSIANRELEAFSYSVAHDLRSPLRLIDAHVQMLRDEEELASPNAVSHMDHIRRGASQMSSLIDGLLALSRVSHVEMKQDTVPLNLLVDQALGHLEQELHLRSIDWHISQLPTLRCDPALIRQVFVNLIGNSVKYTRLRRGARVEIGADVEGDNPHVFVRDNGVGFDMRYANKLFGVFQRLHHPSEFEGTGIGLATVSRIIERHGGRIWAESTLGQGAVFRFTLAGMRPAAS
jgi:signal transduction histidine kinase/CheY-like chemotaxis protein